MGSENYAVVGAWWGKCWISWGLVSLIPRRVLYEFSCAIKQRISGELQTLEEILTYHQFARTASHDSYYQDYAK